MKLKKLLLFIGCGAVLCSTFKHKPIENTIDAFNEQVKEEIISEANLLISNYQLEEKIEEAETFNYSSKEIKENNIIENQTDQFCLAQCEDYIKYFYENLTCEEKETFKNVALENNDAQLIYKICTNQDYSSEIDNVNVPLFIVSTNKESAQRLTNSIKKSAMALGISSSLFASLSSCVSGACTASWVPFVGWAVAAALIAALIIIIAFNWNEIKRCFSNIKNYFTKNYSRISSLTSSAMDNGASEGKANEKPDVDKNATSPNQMQKQVERGQAPRDVDRVDNAHNNGGQPHVHFKDGTSLNRDGSIHDKGKGRPNPSSKVWDWLHGNGWCQNGIK